MDFPSAPQPQASTTPPTFPAPSPAPTPAAPMYNPAVAVPAQPVQIPVQTHAAGPMGSDDQIYTMPDKFIPANQAMATKVKRPRKTMTIILIVVIVLAVLSIIGGVVFYVWQMMSTETVVTDANNAVVVNIPVDNTTVANSNVVANTNLENTNVTAVNANANDNSNLNANANDNSNVANANENTNVSNTNVTNTNTTNTNTTVVVVPPASKDTDQDSLTNEEEKIWGTKADLPDTDSDGYNDGVELLAGYDPTSATSSTRLSASALVSTFTNSEYNYALLYPKNWLAEGLTGGDGSEILITPNTLDLTGQFIAITVAGNPTGFTALDWYMDTANVTEAEVEVFTTFAGQAGAWSTDHTTAYLTDTDYVYAISYRYGNSDALYFPSTHEMMLKSMTFTEPTTKKKDSTNTNANVNN